jgi:predicted nucleic acid-binding protein
LQPYFISKVLEEFIFIEANSSITSVAPLLMSKYNLLSNDAIILATCKIHNITQLASHDKDFKTACESEGITLLTED